jgi:hypothetical protein
MFLAVTDFVAHLERGDVFSHESTRMNTNIISGLFSLLFVKIRVHSWLNLFCTSF